MHVHVLQPALPAYRVDFFDRVAARMGRDFTVYFSLRDFGALTVDGSRCRWARPIGPIRPAGPGLSWQSGALSLPIARGDVVVVPGAPRAVSNMALLLEARRRGARTIWWGQYWTATSKSWRFALRRRLMRLADALLFYTDVEADRFRAALRQPDARPLSALSNGIDTDPIIARRADYDAKLRGHRLLFIGRLTGKAAFSLLLEAMARPELSDVVLEVIGDRRDDRPLREQARRLGVAGRITWHGGTTDEDRIAQVANQCALFVYPGAVGLSLIHAMAYGVPAILHSDRWRHMPEFAAFSDGGTGRSFVPEDPGSLAAAISTSLADIQARERWSAEAIARVETGYNTRVMTDRFCNLVEQLRCARSN